MSEKVENKNRLVELLNTYKSKKVIGTAFLSGIGVALPRVFHILAGTAAGATFLPMHIAVLIAALVFGTISSTVVAGSSIIFSYLLTGMPTLARLPYMLIELIIYGVLLSIMNKKYNPYISLVTTIIIGRIIYSGVLFAAINIIGLPTYGISVIESVKTGMPGIVLQLLCVPTIAKIMTKGLNLNND